MAVSRHGLWRNATLLAIVALLGVLVLSFANLAVATHEPADKVSGSGSTVHVISPGTAVTLLSERVKTAKPTDLILGVTAECSITTDVTTVGSDSQSAEGMVRMWVEIDGTPVPVSSDDAGAGRVVFCNRIYQRQTSLGGDDQNDTVRTFQVTKNANGFTWMALNVGSATHLIELKAELITSSATARASALAAVGNRTLVVEPVKSANDEAVSSI